MVQEENCNGHGRSKVVRGVMVFMLAMVPLAALSWAVLSTEPGVVCGSWWYGLILPLLAAGVHGRRRS